MTPIMNILILDDNSHRITFFQNGLKKHKLTVCSHARAAIKALKKSSFDVIFLDHDLVLYPASKSGYNVDGGSYAKTYCRAPLYA